MVALERRLYRLLLRLHPAAFRNQFAREMALDYDDALRTLGAARLWADLLRSLVHQWTEPTFFPRAADAPIPLHPLLTGQYLMIGSDMLTPFELARGSVLFAVLIFALGFAANIQNNQTMSRLRNVAVNQNHTGLGYAGNPTSKAAASEGERDTTSSDSQLYMVARSPSSAYHFPRAKNRQVHGWGLRRGIRIWSLAELSWWELLLRCTLVSAVIWLISFALRSSRSLGMRAVLTALGLLGVAVSVAFR